MGPPDVCGADVPAADACECRCRETSARASNRTAASRRGSPRRLAALRSHRYLVPADPVIDDAPVEVGEERVDVRAAVGLEVQEVRMLVDVERDERCRVPDREGVLRIADIVEEAPFV